MHFQVPVRLYYWWVFMHIGSQMSHNCRIRALLALSLLKLVGLLYKIAQFNEKILFWTTISSLNTTSAIHFPLCCPLSVISNQLWLETGSNGLLKNHPKTRRRGLLSQHVLLAFGDHSFALY